MPIANAPRPYSLWCAGRVQVPDRCTQGMLNALIVMRLMKTEFYKDPSVIFNGRSVVNPDLRYYDGNSQGGILGTVYMAVSQDVVRGTIGVGGRWWAGLGNAVFVVV